MSPDLSGAAALKEGRAQLCLGNGSPFQKKKITKAMTHNGDNAKDLLLRIVFISFSSKVALFQNGRGKGSSQGSSSPSHVSLS